MVRTRHIGTRQGARRQVEIRQSSTRTSRASRCKSEGEAGEAGTRCAWDFFCVKSNVSLNLHLPFMCESVGRVTCVEPEAIAIFYFASFTPPILSHYLLTLTPSSPTCSPSPPPPPPPPHHSSLQSFHPCTSFLKSHRTENRRTDAETLFLIFPSPPTCLLPLVAAVACVQSYSTIFNRIQVECRGLLSWDSKTNRQTSRYSNMIKSFFFFGFVSTYMYANE